MLLICAALALAPKSPSYLIVNGLVIGRFENRGWHSVEGAAEVKRPIRFNEMRFGPSRLTWTAKGLLKGDPNMVLYAEGDPRPDGPWFSGTVGYPRPVSAVSNAGSVYSGVVRAFLRKNGITSEARITRAVSVDLDGDGTREVILEARNRDNLLDEGMGHKSGDYSLILLRSLRGGRVVETPLFFDHPSKSESMNMMDKLQGIGDLDGDGVMEIVASSAYYEGASATLFRYRRGRLTKLVEFGDGV